MRAETQPDASPTNRSVAVLLGVAMAFLPPLTGGEAQEAGPAASLERRSALVGLDAEVERVMDAWDVPGLALAVVHGDSVLLSRGYGERDVRTGAAVDDESVFAIGSLTKAFTSAATAALVDREVVSWDDRVREHLPWFRLHDPYASREFTLRDAMSHRSGLGRRGDMLWYGSGLAREEVLRRIRHLEPEASFRAAYGYQNIMFLAAGEATAAAAGSSWDELVHDHLLRPLEMEGTSTSLGALDGLENVAAPHERLEGTLRAVPYRSLDNVAPAGSINSNARDMARWMRFQLGRGAIGERRVVGRESLEETWRPHTIMAVDSADRTLHPALDFQAYALGWVVSDQRRTLHLWHTGGIDGMSAYVGLFPEESLGVTVLMNRGGSNAHRAVAGWIYDALLGGERDWNQELLARRDRARERANEARERREASRAEGTAPAFPLEKYAGRYEHEMYGPLRISLEDDALVLRRGAAFVGDLEHWHHETFHVRWRNAVLGELFVTFRAGRSAEIEAVEVEGLGTFRR